MLTVTFDTNTLPLDDSLRALGTVPADVAVTSVTAREVKGTLFEAEITKVHVLRVLLETMVLGESQLGAAVLGDKEGAQLYEALLVLLSNGSFPKPGLRENLTPGMQRLKRDAMILSAHAREKRDVFVSNDTKAIGLDGSDRRRRLCELLGTRVMTLPEFKEFCATLQV